MRRTCYSAIPLTVLLICLVAGPIASGTNEEFKVTEVFLKADDGRPSGPCPLRVVFRGYITANGPGRIKYTFTRSDGANGPVHIMEFKRAGTQAVTTDWTLGDATVLPRYEGWQAVKVLSPAVVESSHETGSFALSCGSSGEVPANAMQAVNPQGPHIDNQKRVDQLRPGNDRTPNPQDRAQLGPSVSPPVAARETGAQLAAAYDDGLSQITAPSFDKFKNDFSKLRSLTEELQFKLDRVAKVASFDTQKLQAEFKSILQEKDRNKLDQRVVEFSDRYEQQFTRQLTAAGIDIGTERQRMASLIGLEQQQVTPEAYLSAHRMLAVGTVSEFVDDRPPVEAAPEFFEDVFAAPFTRAGTRYPGSDEREGSLRSGVGSGPLSLETRPQQNLVYVGQGLSTRRGARRLRVSVSINDLDVYMKADAVGGFASAEFVITLRVFDGARVVATRRVPVERFAATIVGFNRLDRRFPPMTLGCEFERPSTSASGNYLMVVEFETLASSVGIGVAQSSASGRVGPFTVRTY